MTIRTLRTILPIKDIEITSLKFLEIFRAGDGPDFRPQGGGGAARDGGCPGPGGHRVLYLEGRDGALHPGL